MMFAFKSNRRSERLGLIGSSGVFLLLVANCQFVAASVTWTAPPPEWTQTDVNNIRTVNKSVLIGSIQVPLRWNYTALSPDSQLLSTRFSIDDGTSDAIGVISHGSDRTTIFDKNDYRARFVISNSEVATLIINKVTEREEAVYQCELETTTNPWRYRIRVIVTVPAKITNVSGDRGDHTICEGLNDTLFCEATGKPTPNITWTKVLEDGSNSSVLHQGSSWDFPNINRTDSGTYHCTAYNGFGNSDSRKVNVNVTYPARIVQVISSENEVAVQQSLSLKCQAEGNPQPTYTWTPCEPQKSVACHGSVLNISEVLDDGVYTCTVTNSLDSDAGNVSVFIAGKVINVTLVITNEKCANGKYNQSLLWTKLNETMDKVFVNKSGYSGTELKSVRCDSGVIVDLALQFNLTVKEREVIAILRNAAKNGMLGEFQVNVSSITGTRPTTEKTTTVTPTTPTSSSDSKRTWIIVGAVLGSVVVVLVVIGIVAWCVHNKRKCNRKDAKVHNNEPQDQAMGSNDQGGDYAQANRGYASGVSNRSSVPPVTYDTAQAVNKRVGEENAPPQYAVVDKTKKKKKKPKPGELQYAELGEFPKGQGAPRSSTSPTNQPTETQYADVNVM